MEVPESAAKPHHGISFTQAVGGRWGTNVVRVRLWRFRRPVLCKRLTTAFLVCSPWTVMCQELLRVLGSMMSTNDLRAPVADITTGDVVRLKSGGPTMTVGLLHSDRPTWLCDWFDGSTNFSGYFAPEMLALADSEEGEKAESWMRLLTVKPTEPE